MRITGTGGGEVRAPAVRAAVDDTALQNESTHESPDDKSLIAYFLLTGAISLPFLLIGGNQLPLPIQLPASALMFVSPVIAASILTYRQSGWDGLKSFLKKAFDFRKIRHKIWLVPIFLLLPLIFFLSYVVMHLTGQPLPEPDVPLQMVPVFFLLFLIPAVCEELGWTGYALDPMQKRMGALGTAIILGLIWSLWHVIPDIQNGKAADWIFWHRLYSVGLRVLIVWAYNNTGKSVFAAIVLHIMDNVSVFLFPNYGSHYNPMFTAAIMWITVGFVVYGWGAETLARLRLTRTARKA
jgi:membrane protease YdiL (CAAX protease family)